MRYRHTDSDYARIARQQQFLSELKRQTKDFGNLTNITSFRKHLRQEHRDEHHQPAALPQPARAGAHDPGRDSIARVTVQGSEQPHQRRGGRGGARPRRSAPKVAEWKNPEFEEGQAADQKPVDPATVDVAVLNGSGRVLAAEDLAEALRERRYNARAAGNADDFDYGSSVVYYADGFREPGRKIRGLLGASATHGARSTRPTRTATRWSWSRATTGPARSKPPPKPEARPPADTVDTTSLVDPHAPRRSARSGSR